MWGHNPMNKAKRWEVKGFSQGRTTTEWLGLDLSPRSLSYLLTQFIKQVPCQQWKKNEFWLQLRFGYTLDFRLAIKTLLTSCCVASPLELPVSNWPEGSHKWRHPSAANPIGPLHSGVNDKVSKGLMGPDFATQQRASYLSRDCVYNSWQLLVSARAWQE